MSNKEPVVKALKLKNGEELIALVTGESLFNLHLQKPMIVIQNYDDKIENNYFVLHPWVVMKKENDWVDIPKSEVLTAYEVSEEMVYSHDKIWQAFHLVVEHNKKLIAKRAEQERESPTPKINQEMVYVQHEQKWIL